METPYPAETNDGVVTSYLPLTTLFTPAVTCSSQFRLEGSDLVAFDPAEDLDNGPGISCAPSAVVTWWNQNRLGTGNDPGHTAVSLGPVTCPISWTTVASSVRGGSSTLFMCCPHNYFLANGIPGSVVGNCQSGVDSGAVLTFASTPATDSTAWSIATTTLASSSQVGAIAVVGWNIQQVTQTTSSSSASSFAASSSWWPEPLPTSSSSTETTKGAGLLLGATVGIAAGVSIAVVLTILVLAFVLLKKRWLSTAVTLPYSKDRRQRNIQELSPDSASRQHPVELDSRQA